MTSAPLLSPPPAHLRLPAARAEAASRPAEAARATALALLLFAAALTVFLSNQHFLESTDTVGNELLPISLVQRGALDFDQYYAPPNPTGAYPVGADAVCAGSVPPGAAFRVVPDAPTASLPWWFRRNADGHVISLYPIAAGILNTPVFAVADRMGIDLADNVVPLTRISASLIAALSVLAMFVCLNQVSPTRTAVFLSAAFAFGTEVWSMNSRSLFQHGAGVLFIATALAALVSRRPRLVALAGLLLGCAVAARPTNIVIAVALAVYVLRHERRAVGGFLALAAIPAALLAWYSIAYWGTPLALGQGQGLGGFTATEPLVAAAGLLISPNRGLLVFSPILIFSVVFAGYVVRRRFGPPVLAYLAWSSLALYALYTLWSDWAGGHTFGYRYLIELLPGLMLILAACWPRLIEPRPVLRAVFSLALLASIYVNGLGANAAPCGFDDTPNDIDSHHERLWDVANGEIARCTTQQIASIQTRLAAPAS